MRELAERDELWIPGSEGKKGRNGSRGGVQTGDPGAHGMLGQVVNEE